MMIEVIEVGACGVVAGGALSGMSGMSAIWCGGRQPFM